MRGVNPSDCTKNNRVLRQGQRPHHRGGEISLRLIKDRVMRRRQFTQDFKRSIVEQLLSETAGPAELCRRYNISSGQLYTWKRQYAESNLNS